MRQLKELKLVKLYWSPRSPYVRKVMIVAHELGLNDRITCERHVVARPNPTVMQANPLNKIPTLILPDGKVLYDSPVICEYLDGLADGPRLFPRHGPERFTALRRQALGDGLLDILVGWRAERRRPQVRQSPELLDAFPLKTDAVLDGLEAESRALQADPFSIGHVTIGCALCYLDFRYAELEWRRRRPSLADWATAFGARNSIRATSFVDDS